MENWKLQGSDVFPKSVCKGGHAQFVFEVVTKMDIEIILVAQSYLYISTTTIINHVLIYV